MGTMHHNTKSVIDIAEQIKGKYILMVYKMSRLNIVSVVEDNGKVAWLPTYTLEEMIKYSYTLKQAKHLESLIVGRYGASGVYPDYEMKVVLVKVESWYETLFPYVAPNDKLGGNI